MLTLICYAFCWWLGLFLLNRTPSAVLSRIIGIALVLCVALAALLAISVADLRVSPLFAVIASVLIGIGLWSGVRDAQHRYENFWLPMLRSFDAASLTGLFFGVQVALIAQVTKLGEPHTFMLLCSVLASAIFIQTFAFRLADFFDRFAFAYLPILSKQRLNQARADLRAAEDALAKSPLEIPDLKKINEEDFTRLTRRALSSFGDLPKLSTNPLIYLPAIDQRLGTRGNPANTLERTVELKNLLAESISRLKPNETHTFSMAPEWRHYNVLYFPYVRGLKPYTARLNGNGDHAEDVRQVLDWFQRDVPERTLYNWQNAAAKLVAHDLRSRCLN